MSDRKEPTPNLHEAVFQLAATLLRETEGLDDEEHPVINIEAAVVRQMAAEAIHEHSGVRSALIAARESLRFLATYRMDDPAYYARLAYRDANKVLPDRIRE